MFTGLIEEKGKIISSKITPTGKQLIIATSTQFIEKIKIGDSIAINGVCQTAIKIEGNNFYTDVMQESLKKTTLDLKEKTVFRPFFPELFSKLTEF